MMNIFVTGSSGYIGGAVAAALMAAGHRVTGLVRSQERAAALRDRGIETVIGTLDDGAKLAECATASDAVIHCADADHRPSVEAMLAALRGSGKTFIQTSGSSIVADGASGEPSDVIYADDTPVQPVPARAARVALNATILAAAKDGVRAIVIAPTMIYGRGRGLNPNSIQVPKMIALARKAGAAKFIGRGANVWSNVHIEDLPDHSLRALARAPAGAFYYAENGECSMREIAQAIARTMGLGGTASMPLAEAVAEWGEGAATWSMGSNSRVRALRARSELGWAPSKPGLIDEIERGFCTT
jgi:nucleoside-diphosphate-sugar epimerase